MGAKVSRRRVLLFIIGGKLRDPESGRVVPMTNDLPAFTVCCTDAGFVAASPEQRARCLKFWAENGEAPDSYEWQEGSEPVLKIPKKPKPKKWKSPPHTEENDL